PAQQVPFHPPSHHRSQSISSSYSAACPPFNAFTISSHSLQHPSVPPPRATLVFGSLPVTLSVSITVIPYEYSPFVSTVTFKYSVLNSSGFKRYIVVHAS